jgi:riboflavin transporter FmnP
MPVIKPELIIDFVGVIVAVVSVVMLFDLKNKLGGRVGAALNLIMIGIVFNTAALVWTIVFTRLSLFPKPSIDVHHLFMTIGMILFVFAAYKFSRVNQPE